MTDDAFELPPYVKKVVRRNKRRADKVYWYSQPPGLERLQIPHAHGTQAFVRYCLNRNAQAAGLDKPPLVTPGSVRHLADAYRGVPVFGVKPSPAQVTRDPVRYGKGPATVEASQQWRELKPRTRRDYTRYVDRLVERFGDDLAADFDEEIVVALRDSLRETPRVANFMVNVLAAMLAVGNERKRTFGISKEVMGATAIARLGKKAGVTARTAYWTYEAELAFLADADQADPPIALYERLLAYSGQRPSDCRAMTDLDYDGVKIQVVQSKTGARVWVPCHKDLRPHLERAIAAGRAAGLVPPFPLVRGIRGAGMGERYASKRWDDVAARTGTAHLNRQDLRRTAVIRLFEANCNTGQVAAITGHSLKQVETILETYFVRTYEMAQSAIAKLEQHQDLLAAGRMIRPVVVPLAATAEHVALLQRLAAGARLIWRGDAEAGKPYLLEGEKNLGQRAFLVREMVARGWLAPKDPAAQPLELLATAAGAGLVAPAGDAAGREASA